MGEGDGGGGETRADEAADGGDVRAEDAADGVGEASVVTATTEVAAERTKTRPVANPRQRLLAMRFVITSASFRYMPALTL
jgi:hypothetical protein